MKEVRGCQSVLGRAAARLLGKRRREALVLRLDRDGEPGFRDLLAALRPYLAGPLAVLAVGVWTDGVPHWITGYRVGPGTPGVEVVEFADVAAFTGPGGPADPDDRLSVTTYG